VNIPTSNNTISFRSATTPITPPIKPSNNGISHGAQAGIAVGTISVVFFGLLGMFFWWRRRKQKGVGGGSHSMHGGDDQFLQTSFEQPKTAQMMHDFNSTSAAKHAKPTPSPLAAELGSQFRPSELPASEIDNSNKVLEADSGMIISELPADERSPISELHADTGRYEMDTNQQPRLAPSNLETQTPGPIPPPRTDAPV
jgi:hypothetical protein